MRSVLISATIIAAGLLGAQPGMAQATAPGGAVEQPVTAKPARRAPAARSTKEPTVGQMAARERQRKCGVEWKEAKAANRTGGIKWPQYWSRCNARLKGNQA
jgi:hypothetical protein